MLLRINVWISFKGLQDTAFKGVEFPYVAKCPSNGRKSEFGGIQDVYDEIIKIYEEADDKGFNVGKSVYDLSFYFCDHALLANNNMQSRIKEYQFCKTFSCPPYPSLQETPADIIDDFFIIEEEYNHCIKKQQEEKKDA